MAALVGVLFLATGLAGYAADLTAEDVKQLQAAQAAIEAGEHDKAIELLLPLQEKFPTEGDIPRLLAHAYHGQGDFTRARETALEALSVGRLTPDLLVRIAQIDRERDDHLALINTVRLLTILEAENRDWRLLYGDLLAARDSWDESAAVYRSLLAAEPDRPLLQLRLGNVLLKQGRLSEAHATLETAWHLGADNPRIPLTLAGVCQQLGDHHQALAWSERALALGGQADLRLKLDTARLLAKLGEWDRARERAESLAKAAEPDLRAQAHTLLGQIAIEQQRVDDAIGHWQQAVEAGANSPELLAALGAHCFNAGDYPQAADLLQRVVTAEGGERETHLRYLVVSLLRCDRRDDARSFLRQYIELYGLSEEARRLIKLYAAEPAQG